jgi:hypothetical protein
MLKLASIAAAIVMNTVPIEADNEQLSFNHIRTSTYENSLGYTEHSGTYLSIPMELAPGEMVFTQASKTPITMPDTAGTGYAITGFRGEIVYENGDSAPLSEIYDHHWIAVHASHTNALCNGDPEYVVGIGAESRKTPAQFPDGYGYVVSADDANDWSANIHLLHTFGLSGDDLTAARQCNECYYADTKGSMCTPDLNGTFYCCGQDCAADTCYCPTTDDVDMSVKTTYYLSYQVNYTYDLDCITPLDVGVLTTPVDADGNCQLFYGVYQNDDEPETLASSEWESPGSVELVYAVGHQHVGALNISLFINDEFVCASYPRYGESEGVPGDELGYLVEMTTCVDKDKTGSIDVQQGDKIRLDSWYWVGSTDDRLSPYPGGTHLNVMGYMYLGYVLPENAATKNDASCTSKVSCTWWDCEA